ncbi:mitochondrial carrier domain-containing protein [Catenaria anguillulae PL171]|uniref:Mitochondrial carrier domain-containing protein n=1 Tax=Catenaria anguillulae PL171 TaxID=765915 RepID=A0A1Y2HWY3_9FUNG|nr:mitochondrial carrier domain-containing protein [Catenaria anguillulae PL171]
MSHLNLAHAVSGAAGGIVSTLVTYPLITLSSRSQVQPSKRRDDSNNSNPLDKQFGLLDTFRQTIASKGFSSLYAGVHSALFGVTVTNFIYFGVLQQVKSTYLSSADGPNGTMRTLSAYESMVASAVAGAAAVVVSNPIWVVNTRCMCQSEREEVVEGDVKEPKSLPQSKSAWEIVLDIIQHDGIGALWHGLLPALVLVINPIIQFVVFEQARGWAEALHVACEAEFISSTCSSNAAATSLGPSVIFTLSAVAKLVATTITYPSLVLKSRGQFGTDRKRAIVAQHPQQSVLAKFFRIPVIGELVEIVVDEGVVGLYKGFTAKILQSMLTAGILFAAKEELLDASLQIVKLLSRYATMLQLPTSPI